MRDPLILFSILFVTGVCFESSAECACVSADRNSNETDANCFSSRTNTKGRVSIVDIFLYFARNEAELSSM